MTQFKRAQAEKAEKADELYDAAAAALDTLMRGYPQSKYLAQALFYRGDCAYHRGKKDEAAGFYAQAVDEVARRKTPGRASSTPWA